MTNIVGIIISFPSFLLFGVEGSFEDFIDFDVLNVLMFLNIFHGQITMSRFLTCPTPLKQISNTLQSNDLRSNM